MTHITWDEHGRRHGEVEPGWVFYSADFSLNAADHTQRGQVMLKRDPAGTAWWLSLVQEERDEAGLYAVGYGHTFAEAFRNAQRDAQMQSADIPEVRATAIATTLSPDDKDDAARYRWLRGEVQGPHIPLAQVVWKLNGIRDSGEWTNIVDGESLDRNIDAAMKGEGE